MFPRKFLVFTQNYSYTLINFLVRQIVWFYQMWRSLQRIVLNPFLKLLILMENLNSSLSCQVMSVRVQHTTFTRTQTLVPTSFFFDPSILFLFMPCSNIVLPLILHRFKLLTLLIHFFNWWATSSFLFI